MLELGRLVWPPDFTIRRCLLTIALLKNIRDWVERTIVKRGEKERQKLKTQNQKGHFQSKEEKRAVGMRKQAYSHSAER